jgi:hypothetical protein
MYEHAGYLDGFGPFITESVRDGCGIRLIDRDHVFVVPKDAVALLDLDFEDATAGGWHPSGDQSFVYLTFGADDTMTGFAQAPPPRRYAFELHAADLKAALAAARAREAPLAGARKGKAGRPRVRCWGRAVNACWAWLTANGPPPTDAPLIDVMRTSFIGTDDEPGETELRRWVRLVRADFDKSLR